MIKVTKTGILLQKRELEFEIEGVLNPAAIKVGDSVFMFYRAVGKGNHSTVGFCRFDGPLTLAERWDTPIMFPEYEYETQGVEDARITKIDDMYYMTYTGYDGTNARGALATSTDLVNFTKKGLIVPPITYSKFVFLAEKGGTVDANYYQNHNFYYHEGDPEKKIMLWDKNCLFFPRRINGKLVFLHRIRPGIQLVSVNSLDELTHDFWEEYFHQLHDHIVMDPVFPHELAYIGSGCPPIETAAGWLLIYHGVKETQKGLVYCGCAALLDLENPLKEIARLPYPLMVPEFEWELKGEVNNVVFPTGAAVFGETLFIYYGAADDKVACANVNLAELVTELLSYKAEINNE